MPLASCTLSTARSLKFFNKLSLLLLFPSLFRLFFSSLRLEIVDRRLAAGGDVLLLDVRRLFNLSTALQRPPKPLKSPVGRGPPSSALPPCPARSPCAALAQEKGSLEPPLSLILLLRQAQVLLTHHLTLLRATKRPAGRPRARWHRSPRCKTPPCHSLRSHCLQRKLLIWQ